MTEPRRTFADLMKSATEKEKPKLELVQDGKPRTADVVNHESNNAVDQIPEIALTTNKNVVNNPTTNEKDVNKTTAENTDSGKQSNKITTDKSAVNHKGRDWSTIDKRRGTYGGTVESFRTSEDFKQKIKVFCAENKIDKQDFYRLAVNHYFDTAVNQKQPDAVNLLTLDDRRLKTLYKTKPLIINLYLRYNSIFNEKTKWTVRDDDAGQSVNDLDIKIIELGIIQTQANKRFEGKINSFSYYLPEINNFSALDMSGEVLDAMLNVNRQRWQQMTGKTIDLEFLDE
jgi:hypothetical protein